VGLAPKQLVDFLLEDDPDVIRPKDYLQHLDNQMPSHAVELDGIARWVRDSSSATGNWDESWEWDYENRILTVHNEDGTISTVSGEEIADSTPTDWRLNRLRGP
jgi:hypothetical protein